MGHIYKLCTPLSQLFKGKSQYGYWIVGWRDPTPTPHTEKIVQQETILTKTNDKHLIIKVLAFNDSQTDFNIKLLKKKFISIYLSAHLSISTQIQLVNNNSSNVSSNFHLSGSYNISRCFFSRNLIYNFQLNLKF